MIGLPAHEARDLLSYDPGSGVLRWRRKVVWHKEAGDVAGSLHSSGYIHVFIRGRVYKAHRLVWLITFGEWPVGFLDHADGDKSNNRLSNLRHATREQNAANSRPKRRGKLKGAYLVSAKKHTRKCWSSRIIRDGKNHALGYFETEQEAHAAYLAAAAAMDGEFLRAA